MKLRYFTFFLVICFIIHPISYAGGIKVKQTYELHTLNNGKAVSIVTTVLIKFKDEIYLFAPVDKSYRMWTIEWKDQQGLVKLTVSEDEGVRWEFSYNGAEVYATIALTESEAGYPRMIPIVSTINTGKYFLENYDKDCAAQLVFYQIPSSHDPDIEYKGPMDLEINSTHPCHDGKWKVAVSDDELDNRIRASAIFTSVLSLNIRYLLQ